MRGIGKVSNSFTCYTLHYPQGVACLSVNIIVRPYIGRRRFLYHHQHNNNIYQQSVEENKRGDIRGGKRMSICSSKGLRKGSKSHIRQKVVPQTGCNSTATVDTMHGGIDHYEMAVVIR